MAKKKKKIKVDKTKKLRCHKLAWQILGHKFLYYQGSKYKLKPVMDSRYDKIEEEYKDLCEEIGIEPTASDMVGFDETRGSCRMVKQHLIANKGRFPGNIELVKETVKEVKKKVNVFMEELQEVMEEVGLDEKKQKKIRIKMKKRMKP